MSLLLALLLQEEFAREFTKTWDGIVRDYHKQLFELDRTELPGRPFESICAKGREKYPEPKKDPTFKIEENQVRIERDGKASILKVKRVGDAWRATEWDCRFPFPMILPKKLPEIGAAEGAQAYVDRWTIHVAKRSEAFLKFLDDVEKRIGPYLVDLEEIARARRQLRADGELRGEKGWATLSKPEAQGPFSYVVLETAEGKHRLQLAKTDAGWQARRLQSVCISCPGDGKCKYCEGRGSLTVGKCEACSGTGTCWLCEGSGWSK